MALIYGVLRILHIAHGTMLLIGAYCSLLLLPFFGNNLFVTVLIGSLMAGVLGTLMGIGIYVPLLKKRNYDAILLASVAALIVSQEALMVMFGARHKQFPMAINAITADILGVKVFLIQLICAITSFICMLLLWFFLSKTDTGRAIRAVDQNPILASLCGINFLKICIITLFIGSTLGGLSGGLLGLYYNDVHPELAGVVTIALCIIIVGGLGSIPGSIVAGLLIALLETFALAYIPISFPRTLVSFAALVIVLLLRPKGIMGRRQR
jgi:branched-chain amino acid transport system permease protein